MRSFGPLLVVGGGMLALIGCLPTLEPALDLDFDGFSVDAAGNGDCDDGAPDTYPGAPESCDGRDNSCNGQVDEGFSDEDQDGTADCADEESCDGLDNNGDGRIDEAFPDSDSDGRADCLAAEVCDGQDNNGDGQTDEGFPDTDGDGQADCVDPDDCSSDTDDDGTPDCIDLEECDGLDNDGDGRIDEAFPDSDRDGRADCVDMEACDGLDNDGDGDIDEGFPDSNGDGTPDCLTEEICDGLDNDGDGIVDEGFDQDWVGGGDCSDDDGDGFSEAQGDCNDASPQAHPDFPYELYGDNLDNNCNGAQNEGTGLEQTLPVNGAATNAGAGAALLTVDLDGDGLAEVLVGAPGDPAPSGGGVPLGAVYVLPGSTALPVGSLLDDALRLETGNPDDGLGTSLVVLQGSKIRIVAGAPRHDGGRGAIAVWTWNPQTGRPTAMGPVLIGGIRAADGFGATLAALDDLDGDGEPELAVGAPTADPGSSTAPGAVFVLDGDRLDVPSSAGPLALASIFGESSFSGLGGALAAVPDLEGDGRVELLAGAPNFSDGSYAEVGRAYLFYSGEGLSACSISCALRITGSSSSQHLGTGVASAGDLFARGSTVLALGSVSLNSVEPLLYYPYVHLLPFGTRQEMDPDGDGRVAASEDLQTLAGPLLARPELSLAGGEDFDGDRVPDLLVGFPSDEAGEEYVDSGLAFLVTGPRALASSSLTSSLVSVMSYEAGTLLGWAGALSDLDLDGNVELLVGAPGLRGGEVYVVPGF